MMPSTLIRSCSAVAVLAVGAFTAGSASAVPTIGNGSFESPAETPDSLTEITGQTIDGGWFGSSIAGKTHEYIINGNIQDLSGNYFGYTPYGQQYLGLNAVANNSFHSIESQVVGGFTPGLSYVLTLYIANLDGATDPNIFVTASADSGTGTLLNSATFTAPAGGPAGQFGTINFVPETLTFTATTSTVSFSINNNSRTGVMGIDNVSVALAVPEPATTAALGVGLAPLAWVGLRRRSQRG